MNVFQRLCSENMQDFQTAVRDLLLIPKDEAIRLLNKLAHDPNGELRARAIDGMTKLFPDQSEATLIELLDDPEWFVRVSSIDSLSKMRSRSAVPKIATLLALDADDGVRSWAAFFLGVVGDESVIPILMNCIDADKGYDHEGTPIPEIAGKAIEKIRSRLAIQ